MSYSYSYSNSNYFCYIDIVVTDGDKLQRWVPPLGLPEEHGIPKKVPIFRKVEHPMSSGTACGVVTSD